ncbi:ribosomal-protein-alanine acetyltransferase [Bacillus velezensis AS43.3]|nr:ribosomal-protein-alanine acetyltransferase [Bacillus velezensis AS43.3]
MPKHKRAEDGYEIHPKYWRNGYAFEALENVLSFGFEKLGLHRIGAVVFIENAASHQLLIKAGFQSEGILEKIYVSKRTAP